MLYLPSYKYSYMPAYAQAHAPSGKDPHTHKDTQRDTLVSLPAVILLLTLGRRVDEKRGQCAGSERLSVRGSPGF